MKVRALKNLSICSKGSVFELHDKLVEGYTNRGLVEVVDAGTKLAKVDASRDREDKLKKADEESVEETVSESTEEAVDEFEEVEKPKKKK